MTGLVLTLVGLVAAAGLALLWFIGDALVGVAIERAGVLPRGTGWLLAAGALCFAGFEEPFLPVVGQFSVLLFVGAQMSLGWALIRDGRSD